MRGYRGAGFVGAGRAMATDRRWSHGIIPHSNILLATGAAILSIKAIRACASSRRKSRAVFSFSYGGSHFACFSSSQVDDLIFLDHLVGCVSRATCPELARAAGDEQGRRQRGNADDLVIATLVTSSLVKNSHRRIDARRRRRLVVRVGGRLLHLLLVISVNCVGPSLKVSLSILPLKRNGTW